MNEDFLSTNPEELAAREANLLANIDAISKQTDLFAEEIKEIKKVIDKHRSTQRKAVNANKEERLAVQEYKRMRSDTHAMMEEFYLKVRSSKKRDKFGGLQKDL